MHPRGQGHITTALSLRGRLRSFTFGCGGSPDEHDDGRHVQKSHTADEAHQRREPGKERARNEHSTPAPPEGENPTGQGRDQNDEDSWFLDGENSDDEGDGERKDHAAPTTARRFLMWFASWLTVYAQHFRGGGRRARAAARWRLPLDRPKAQSAESAPYAELQLPDS